MDSSDDEETFFTEPEEEVEDGDEEESESAVQILTTQQVFQGMDKCIDEINAVLQLPRTTVRLLLNHFSWMKDSLLEAFFDGNTEKLFEEAGIVSPAVAVTSVPEKARGTDGTVKDCEICFVECPSSAMHGVECGHRFCVQCWLTYLTTRIMDEGQGQFISCPGHKCPVLVPDVLVMEIVVDPNVKQKYQQLITNSYVQKNRLLRWCPSPGCSNAIQVDFVKWQPVSCTCGHTFCFQCGNDWHEPVRCKWLEKWLINEGPMSDAQVSMQWLNVNTKKCPKCNVSIEKNGGCNRMVCINQDCNMEFCWLCLGPWEVHGYSNCNRYDDSEVKAARDAYDEYQALLRRYRFYRERYINHKRSLAFETELYDSMKKVMQQGCLNCSEVEFLKKAIDVLCQCRQTLSYSYIFAFFLEKTNQVMIFEDNQRDLELATELLSGYLEGDLTSKVLVNIRQKVQDKYVYCDTRRKILLDHVHEGFAKDWWIYDKNWSENA